MDWPRVLVSILALGAIFGVLVVYDRFTKRRKD